MSKELEQHITNSKLDNRKTALKVNKRKHGTAALILFFNERFKTILGAVVLFWINIIWLLAYL